MDFQLLTGYRPLLLLLTADALLMAFLWYPLVARYSDDQGDGMALVLLPKPKLPSFWLVPAFGALFLTLMVGYHSLRGSWSPDQAYTDLVTRICLSVVRSPAEVNGYLAGFTLGLRFLTFGTILCIAVVGRGNLPRRLLIAFQAFVYLGVMAFVDATLVVAEVLVGAPVAPTTLLGNFAAVGLAVLAMTRMQYLNFALPKPSEVPFVKRPRLSDALTLLGVTVAAMAICMAGLLWIYHVADPALRPALALVLPVPFAEGSFVIRTMLLALVNGFTVRPEPPVGDDRPRIDVIIPAYNEEEVIEPTLRAIDAAAGRYGGPIRVILMNDGSTDGTGSLARLEGARVVTGDTPSGGKGQAMRVALREAEGDLIAFVDGDVTNFGAHFVTGLLGPLLPDDGTTVVKGFYQRPLNGEPDGGGRVTELMARPVIDLLVPALGVVRQPLAGETAAPRWVFEKCTLADGYAVELALLIDVASHFGVETIAQVDLGVRAHRNRPLSELRPQATDILAAALARSPLLPAD